MERTFTCGLCGETFTSDPGFTEEDRLAEMQSYFGNVPAEDRASVCEDCFQKIHPANHSHEVEEAAAGVARAVHYPSATGTFIPQPTGQVFEIVSLEELEAFNQQCNEALSGIVNKEP